MRDRSWWQTKNVCSGEMVYGAQPDVLQLGVVAQVQPQRGEGRRQDGEVGRVAQPRVLAELQVEHHEAVQVGDAVAQLALDGPVGRTGRPVVTGP